MFQRRPDPWPLQHQACPYCQSGLYLSLTSKHYPDNNGAKSEHSSPITQPPTMTSVCSLHQDFCFHSTLVPLMVLSCKPSSNKPTSTLQIRILSFSSLNFGFAEDHMILTETLLQWVGLSSSEFSWFVLYYQIDNFLWCYDTPDGIKSYGVPQEVYYWPYYIFCSYPTVGPTNYCFNISFCFYADDT